MTRQTQFLQLPRVSWGTQSRNAHPGTDEERYMTILYIFLQHLNSYWIGQFFVSLDSRVLLYWRYWIGYPHPLLVDTPIYQRSNPNPVFLKIAIVRRLNSKLLIIPHWLLAPCIHPNLLLAFMLSVPQRWTRLQLRPHPPAEGEAGEPLEAPRRFTRWATLKYGLDSVHTFIFGYLASYSWIPYGPKYLRYP